MILTVTMNPSIDMSYPVDHLKIDDVNRVTDVRKTAGGKGLNVTRVIHQLGKSVVATGIIGGYFGKFIEARLDDDKIKHDFFRINQETRNSIAILHDDGKQTEILEPGPQINTEQSQSFLQYYQSLLKNCSLITMSGSLPRGLNDDFYSQMIKITHMNSTKVLLDTSGAALKAALLNDDKPNLIKPNEEELQQLINKNIDISDLDQLKLALSNSIFDGIEWICVSLGGAGAFAKHFNQFYQIKIPKISVINPVGSGDSTLAGLAVSIEENRNDIDILKTAMTTGMLNTMEKQTGFINPDLFDEYFEKVQVNKR
ncbi:tagatose-6-phosphate kinase [Loigolactobacillus iwatensis]|uniref:tagatose-6-phosphate kinase n=1 Tax=Loigolactobacillus iwatensis TaxID=1267156 RepID=UPI000F7D7AA2|nr:tagatose-6-phosphate kinase [Loigolactobacillus iwatensis]